MVEPGTRLIAAGCLLERGTPDNFEWRASSPAAVVCRWSRQLALALPARAFVDQPAQSRDKCRKHDPTRTGVISKADALSYTKLVISIGLGLFIPVGHCGSPSVEPLFGGSGAIVERGLPSGGRGSPAGPS